MNLSPQGTGILASGPLELPGKQHLRVVKELEAMASANLQRATRLRQPILQMVLAGELV